MRAASGPVSVWPRGCRSVRSSHRSLPHEGREIRVVNFPDSVRKPLEVAEDGVHLAVLRREAEFAQPRAEGMPAAVFTENQDVAGHPHVVRMHDS